MKLLIVRPQPGADATAARVKAAGHYPLLMPLFAVEPVAWASPSRHYDGLLLTSANAVRHAGAQLAALAQLPVFAVGAVTATAATKAGLAVAHSGEAGVSELLAGLERQQLLWLAGEDHMPIAAPSAVQIDVSVVYKSRALPVPPDFAAIVESADHVLLHSARAADYFAEAIASCGLFRAEVSIAALSGKIAAAAGRGWRAVHVAPEPNDAALLSCLLTQGKARHATC